MFLKSGKKLSALHPHYEHTFFHNGNVMVLKSVRRVHIYFFVSLLFSRKIFPFNECLCWLFCSRHIENSAFYKLFPFQSTSFAHFFSMQKLLAAFSFSFLRSHFILRFVFDSNRLLMRFFFFNWIYLYLRHRFVVSAVRLLYFVNGFFCIVNRMAEASLEVMTSFMHLDNNNFFLFVWFEDRHLC